MTKHKFDTIKIESVSDDHDANYLIHGLPHGEDFRESASYDTLEASWLKVEGVGFATAGAEFGEHGVPIIVEQETDGGAARIEFDR